MKIIRQQKIYSIGKSLYVLIPKDVRDKIGINKDSVYRLEYINGDEILIKIMKKKENGEVNGN